MCKNGFSCAFVSGGIEHHLSLSLVSNSCQYIQQTLPNRTSGLGLASRNETNEQRPRPQYDLYRKQIRQEYQHFPDPAFNTGRMGVLRKLGEGSIYFTEWWKSRGYELAKSNIAWEIGELEKADIA